MRSSCVAASRPIRRSGSGLLKIRSTKYTCIRDLGPDIQWVHSYVSDDKITCVGVAANEDIIHEHGGCGGFAVDAVSEVRTIIDPTTAEMVP
jgi:hypothetical protein